MVIAYPSPLSMYTSAPQNGLAIEGRFTRQGGGSMEIGTLTRDWRVTNVVWTTRMVPEIPGIPIQQVNYTLDIDTYPPADLFNDIKRFDALSWWKLSGNEVLRHHANAQLFKADPLWEKLLELRDQFLVEVHDLLCQWLDVIVNHGDFSFEHFTFYVKEHEDSASPWQMKWSEILDNPVRLRSAFDLTNKWIYDFVSWFKRLKPKDPIYIRANYAYPGVRARPGDYTVVEKRDHHFRVMASKWRDRKVGGIVGLSQLTYPIYKNEVHKQADALLHNWIARTLKCELVSLSDEGPIVYKKLMDAARDLFVYDLKTAEKLTGLLWQALGFAADLSDPHFPAEFAAEMYSGIGPTSQLNELTITLVLLAIMMVHGIQIKKLFIFSDNFATDKELPPNAFADVAEAFCGLLLKERRFGPTSLVTDNPKHRLRFNGITQRQTQHLQYYMKPFLSVCLGNLADPESCYKFIDLVSAMKLPETNEPDSWRKDHMKELILSLEPEAHHHITEKFPKVMEFIDAWFFVQRTDPQYNSIRVT